MSNSCFPLFLLSTSSPFNTSRVDLILCSCTCSVFTFTAVSLSIICYTSNEQRKLYWETESLSHTHSCFMYCWIPYVHETWIDLLLEYGKGTDMIVSNYHNHTKKLFRSQNIVSIGRKHQVECFTADNKHQEP